MLAVFLSEVLVQRVVWALAHARRVPHDVAAAYALVVKFHVCHSAPSVLWLSAFEATPSGLRLSALEALPRGLWLPASESPAE